MHRREERRGLFPAHPVLQVVADLGREFLRNRQHTLAARLRGRVGRSAAIRLGVPLPADVQHREPWAVQALKVAPLQPEDFAQAQGHNRGKVGSKGKIFWQCFSQGAHLLRRGHLGRIEAARDLWFRHVQAEGDGGQPALALVHRC